MKKILFLQVTNCLGGIERFIMNYIVHHEASELNIGVLTECSDYIMHDFWSDNNITVHVVPSRKNYVRYIKQLKEVIRNYDIIHINKNSLIDISAIKLAKKLKKKIIVHSHNTSSSVKTKLLFLHELHKQKVNKIADIKLACSDIAGQWLFGDSNFIILPNGVDTDIFTIKDAGLKKDIFGLDDVKVYGTICRLTEQKNLLFLIDIFKELYLNDERSRFIVIGNGPLMSNIKDRIEKLNLSNVCILTGEVMNPQDYYGVIDFVVSPSLFEGFPMSLVEAQACGKLVFASKNITEEIKVTDGVHFISLDKTAEEWAYIVQDKIDKNILNEADIRNQFLLSPYNIKYTANLLDELYLKA